MNIGVYVNNVKWNDPGVDIIVLRSLPITDENVNDPHPVFKIALD